MPVLADDSGLVVDSLKGEPGIYSARYASLKATDLENNQKLLKNLKPFSNRIAFFVCVLCYLKPSFEISSFDELTKKQKQTCFFEGVCNGTIAKSLKGKNGFGYDPYLSL